jgi:hypothetical protein
LISSSSACIHLTAILEEANFAHIGHVQLFGASTYANQILSDDNVFTEQDAKFIMVLFRQVSDWNIPILFSLYHQLDNIL